MPWSEKSYSSWCRACPLSALGHLRHYRGAQRSAFVRFTPLATILGAGPIGREWDGPAVLLPRTSHRGGFGVF